MTPGILEVRLNGRCLRLPLGERFKGQVRVSVVNGELLERQGQLFTLHEQCADCGSTRILTAGTLVGMASES